MAAPTDVRVEATSISTTTIRWTYPGASSVKVYRSTNAVDYSVVATISVGTTEYNDTDLATATKYYYKLSDDSGSTYSSIVDTYTYACPEGSGNSAVLALPRADTDVTPTIFNELADRVEEREATNFKTEPCFVCVDDGRIVFNCSTGCTDFVTVLTEDINSVSFIGCSDITPSVDFIVPPNECVSICGFPKGILYSGDECQQAGCIPGGTEGRTFDLQGYSRNGYGYNSDDPSPCSCLPSSGNALTIKCCSDDCTLECS
jgi:hypothetical protein